MSLAARHGGRVRDRWSKISVDFISDLSLVPNIGKLDRLRINLIYCPFSKRNLLLLKFGASVYANRIFLARKSSICR